MVDFVKWLHELIREKGVKWFTKLAYVVAILLLFYFIDDHFGWSYYSRTNNQVLLLKNINECLKDTTNSKDDIDFLREKKLEIINRKNLIEGSWTNIKYIFSRINSSKSSYENIKFEFLHGQRIIPFYCFFITNIGVIFLMFMEILRIFRQKTTFKKRVINFFTVFLSLVLICSINTLTLVFIPVIWENNTWLNYVLYFLYGSISTYQIYKERKKGTFLIG